LSRSFRVYQKKRGNRRTGSTKLGSAGEAAFFGVFLLLGCGGLVVVFKALIIPEWRVNQQFVKHTCVVHDKRVGRSKSNGTTLYRPDILVEYELDGQRRFIETYDIGRAYSSERKDSQAAIDRFVVGRRYACWYDPADPSVVVLVREHRWWIWLTLIVPVSFVLIGGGGFIYRALHWGKSAERRAANTGRMMRLERLDRQRPTPPEYPNVPADADMTNSPGTRLAFRLPIVSSPAWALFGALLACLIWNGVVSVFVVVAIGGHLKGDPDWLGTIFILPFVAVGVGLIVFFVRQLLVTSGIGLTLVEISDHPLYPAKQYRLFLSQSGRLRMNSLEVLLVCEEKARYRQGTDTRTETRRVYQQEVFRRVGFEVRRGTPFEAQCEFQVPAGAMHSFKSGHNEINWKLIVQGDVAAWPNYRRSFPVVVYPGNGQTSSG